MAAGPRWGTFLRALADLADAHPERVEELGPVLSSMGEMLTTGRVKRDELLAALKKVLDVSGPKERA